MNSDNLYHADKRLLESRWLGDSKINPTSQIDTY